MARDTVSRGGMQKSWKRVSALMRKEFIQLLRDWRTLALLLVAPILEMFLLAYAVSLTVDHIPTVIADLSLDTRSRDFVNALEISGFFDVALYVSGEVEVIRAIDEGRARAGVVIPPDFSVHIERGDAQVLLLLDGSDAFTLQSGYGAALAIAQTHATELMMEKISRRGAFDIGQLPISTFTRILYNPDMDDMTFIIPAMAAMLVQIVAVGMTAMSVVREREVGTIEQLLVTPVRPLELIVGKLTPNILIAAIDLACVILFGNLWFGVAFKGDLWLFVWLSLVFIISGLGLGLLVSTVTRTQKEAQQATAVLMLVAMMLSGFIYPRAPMPPLVRAVGNLIPLTYFNNIIRGIVTKGVGLTFIWHDALVLIGYAVLVMLLAALTFKKRLD